MKRICAIALICLLMGLTVCGCGTQEPAARVTLSAPAQDAPMGMRRFLNYNGHRYAFLENGGSYRLPEGAATEKLGTLEHDILQDPKNGKKDLSATFALGGILWETGLWDPEFRVAVELEGNWYLCENVDDLGDGSVDLKAYFAAADFAHTAESAQIMDHLERETFLTLSKQETGELVELLAQCEAAELSDEDYEKVGKAQREGGSYRIRLNLRDGTDYGFYLIPELELAMIGDNKYALPENFEADFGETFRALPREEIPMM